MAPFTHSVYEISSPSLSTTASSSLQISNIVRFVSIKLNDQNCLSWKNKIYHILISQDLCRYVNGSYPAPPTHLDDVSPNPAFFEWCRANQYVHSCINAILRKSILAQTIRLRNSKEIWDSLAATFTHQSQARIMQLRLKL